RDQRDLHTLIAEAGGGQLRHVAGAENQGAAAGQIAEDLACHGDAGGRGRRRPHPETGFRSHPRPDMQRSLEQPMQHGAGLRTPPLAPAAMTRASAPGTSCAPCAKRSRTSSGAVRWFTPTILMPIAV